MFTVDYKRLLSALFLTNVFTLHRQTQRKAMETNLPEYIEGIPTGRNRKQERRLLISNYYNLLWKKLQRQGTSNYVYNNYLGVNIYIVKGESDKKTMYIAANHWKSTFAIKHLETILENASSLAGFPLFDKVEGKNTQKKNGYKGVALLYYSHVDDNFDYMNFMIKVTIGIKEDGKHIQYCVNKITVK